MPVPTDISELSTTESANSPQGTETAKGVIDNYFRRHASFIAQLRDQILAIPASNIQFLQSGTGAVSHSVQDALRERVSVFQFMTDAQIADVKARTLTLDVTSAIQAAIAYAGTSNIDLYFPAGWYKVTSSLVLPAAVRLVGANASGTDWRVAAMPATKIKLVTASNIDLFTVDQSEISSGYVWGMGISRITLEGSNIAGSRGMYLKNVACGDFSDLGISKFGRGQEVELGMMNTFNRVNASGCIEASFYLNGVGPTTSQTFNNCVGRESQWAWIMQSTATGYSIGTILNNCLMESTTAGGVSQHRSCSAEYIGTYAENAPDDRVIVNGSMFNLFNDGVNTSPFDSVAVFRGGNLAGGNFGLFAGSTVIDIGDAKYVYIDGTVMRRATNGIRTAAGTKSNCMYVNSPQFVSITNNFTGTAGKVTGVYPSTNLAGSPVSIADFGEVHAPAMFASTLAFPAVQVPSADPNTLDDYEEGTFTAALTASTSGTITLTGGYTTGAYTKVGRKVLVTGVFVVASVSAPVGVLRLTGLPFAVATGVSNEVAAKVSARYLTGVTTESIDAIIPAGASAVEIALFTNGSPVNMASKVQAGTEIRISATYNAA